MLPPGVSVVDAILASSPQREGGAMTDHLPRHTAAERIAQAIGAPSPSPTGRCHWCGLPLSAACRPG